MKKEVQSLAGKTFGKWTVLDQFTVTPRGERKWLCRCECGTEREVLERSLKYGGSASCGCVGREKAVKTIAYDLTGKVFGELTVLKVAEKQRKNGGVWWTCRCSCGNEYDAAATLLVTGRRTRCTGKAHQKNYASSDISGQRFDRLTALYPTEKRGRSSVIWHCRCDCGNEVDVSLNSLVYSNMRSCGCQKKEHDKMLPGFLTRVDGTSLDMVRSKKIPADNTTGYRGVYFIRGRYVAKIVFQKKAYYLGVFNRIEDAAEARKEAEEVLFDGMSAFYEKWKAKADRDPQWGKENPVKVTVVQHSEGHLSVSFLPIM